MRMKSKQGDREEMTRRELLSRGGMIAGAVSMSALLPGRLSAMASQLDAPKVGPAIEWVSTTQSAAWQAGTVSDLGFTWDMLDAQVRLDKPAQTMEGFGACFSELGWVALQQLSTADREGIFRELFLPGAGANFTLCRLPIGANDYARNWYSYDEVDSDFELKHFSIANDMETLIPFLHEAQRFQPKLRLWSSPWSPPIWMKRNKAYAEAQQRPGWPANGLRSDQAGHEGEDMFVQEEQYFAAYARYFGRYIDAYRAQGVPVEMVMPQNEFNSAQAFPSCTWTAQGLAKFIRHLGPVMDERGVKIFFGTLERGNVKLLETVMDDPIAAQYVRGVGVQWAGKNALTAIHETYPGLAIYGSEQECGDGKNDWKYSNYCWNLMKDYLKSGASGYLYWNLALETGGVSRWGWPQNSLISVDPLQKTFRYNPEFYLLKHASHYVLPGARRLETAGSFDDLIAFQNVDGSIAVVGVNERPYERPLRLHAGKQSCTIIMAPQSLHSVLFRS
jgi:glucosylceramidase